MLPEVLCKVCGDTFKPRDVSKYSPGNYSLNSSPSFHEHLLCCVARDHNASGTVVSYGSLTSSPNGELLNAVIITTACLNKIEIYQSRDNNISWLDKKWKLADYEDGAWLFLTWGPTCSNARNIYEVLKGLLINDEVKSNGKSH